MDGTFYFARGTLHSISRFTFGMAEQVVGRFNPSPMTWVGPLEQAVEGTNSATCPVLPAPRTQKAQPKRSAGLGYLPPFVAERRTLSRVGIRGYEERNCCEKTPLDRHS